MSEFVMLDAGKNNENKETVSKADILFENERRNENQNEEKQFKEKTVWVTRSIAEEIGREEVLKKTVIEFLVYVVFVTFATIYIIGISKSSYYLTKGLRQQFVEHEFSTLNGVGITFEQIKTAADFWFYIETHMVNSFYWESTYGIGKEANENAMNILYENEVLGAPRIRQLKVRNDSCTVHEYFRTYFLACFAEYSYHLEDTQSFGLKKKPAWVYSDSHRTKSLPYWGKISVYDGGGYYVDFGETKAATINIIQTLKDNIWITRGTRVVFVDFTVYNANINMFGVSKLVFEFPTTGGVIPSASFRCVRLIRFHTNWDWFILVCECICYLFVLYYVMEEIREMVYFGARYFTRFWNYVDLSIIALLLTGLILYLFAMMEVELAIKKMKKWPKKYANLEHVTDLQWKRNSVIAVALFLMYLKVFKFLNFNRTMGQLNNTLNKCALDVLGFSMMFFIIFFAYAELGYLLFGNQVENFSTFGVAMFTLLRTILGDFDYQEIEEANRILAPIYFLTYIFLVFFVLLNMFLAIINDTYSDVKTEIAIAPDEMQMTEYLQKKFGDLLRKWGCGRFLPEKSKEKSEINATIREIREVLKKCGFSDLEIEMFFARYNIDPLAQIQITDTEKLFEELTDILKKEDDGGVKLKDFISQQERLQQIENEIGKLVEQVKTLIENLERMENITKERV